MKPHSEIHNNNDNQTVESTQITWECTKTQNHSKYFLACHDPNLYLTQREAQILTLIPNRTYQDIADLLNISKRTVEAYAHKIIVKLHCKTKRELNNLINQYDLINQLENIIEFN